MSPILTSIKDADGYLVPQPRASDAIGGLLRRTYAKATLPEDMLALLRRIDRRG